MTAGVWSFVAAAAAMALKDACGTMLVICEARNRPLLAGTFDALGDLALILVTLFGAGEVILHGWTLHTVGVIAVIVTTSFFGTALWTHIGNRCIPK